VTETPEGQIIATGNSQLCTTLTTTDGTLIGQGCTWSHPQRHVEVLGDGRHQLVLEHRNLKQNTTFGEVDCVSHIIFHYANGEVRVNETRLDCS
jgi:hypothetical protein